MKIYVKNVYGEQRALKHEKSEEHTRVKILFLSNNIEVTNPLYLWLCEVEGTDNVSVWEAPLDAELFENVLKDFNFIISYNYQHIVKQSVISLFPNRIINLHISLLPWNRGISPNLWSVIDDTPKGVTIHLIDDGVDTGDILIQQQLFLDDSTETLASSYQKLHKAMLELFVRNWSLIKQNKIIPKKQNSCHTRKETENVLKQYDIKWDDSILSIRKKISLFNQHTLI